MGKEDPTGWKVGTKSKDWAVYSSKIVAALQHSTTDQNTRVSAITMF